MRSRTATPDVDPSALRRELERVRQQIQQHLLYLALVRADVADARIDRAPEPDLAPLRPLAHQRQRVVDGARQTEFRKFQFHPPRLDLGEVEDVVDEGQQVSSRFEDVGKVLGLLVVDLAEHPLVEHFREADDRVERRAQLVRHVGEELALVPARRLELAALRRDLAEEARVLDRERRLRGKRLQQVATCGANSPAVFR
jgi:hypothetical protein